jgi:hypothetical protein
LNARRRPPQSRSPSETRRGSARAKRDMATRFGVGALAT